MEEFQLIAIGKLYMSLQSVHSVHKQNAKKMKLQEPDYTAEELFIWAIKHENYGFLMKQWVWYSHDNSHKLKVRLIDSEPYDRYRLENLKLIG